MSCKMTQNHEGTWAGSTTPTASEACICTIAAKSDKRIKIGMLSWGYSATPPAGSLIQSTGAEPHEFRQPAVSAGPAEHFFIPPLEFPVDTAAVFTLSDPGASITGYLNVIEVL